MLSRVDRLRGLMIGAAVGDALGLPLEGLSPRRARRLFPPPWRHRLVCGRGMVSDDTEHSLFVAQCLLAYPRSVERFVRRLAWCLRAWLLGLPAGVGLATLRATLRLWLGLPPHQSGVYSAGNGPAMRIAPIGAALAGDPERRRAYVKAATWITHMDPRAFVGALAVAEIAAWIVRDDLVSRPDGRAFIDVLHTAGEDDAEWNSVLGRVEEAAQNESPVSVLAERLGLAHGVTGYVYHTVPIAVYAWYRDFGDFERTLVDVLECGGDTDTVGSIAGGLAGLVVGETGMPELWVKRIFDWPRGVRVWRCVADRLTSVSDGHDSPGVVRYFVPGLVLRNHLQLLAVLGHGFRRLAPPY